MRRWGMLVRMVSKAAWFRPAKLSASLGALTVGATLASAFLSLYFVLPSKLSGEFRAVGANLVIAPRQNEQTFSEDLYKRICERQPQLTAVPWLYAIGQVADRNVVLGGADIEKAAAVNPEWRVLDGRDSGRTLQMFLKDAPPLNATEEWLLAGAQAAPRLGWTVGQTVEITYDQRTIRVPVRAVVSTGGSEDSQLLLPLHTVQELTSQAGRLTLLQARAAGSREALEATRREIDALVPELETRPLRQVVESETRVIMKVRSLMYGLTAVVLAIVILSVMTTVSGLVLDRQCDIGIMKTLGGSDGMISFLFLAEMTASAVLAATLGYWVGFGLAHWAARGIFHSALPWRWDVLASVVGVTVVIALAATAIPIRLVRKLEPAVILKGN